MPKLHILIAIVVAMATAALVGCVYLPECENYKCQAFYGDTGDNLFEVGADVDSKLEGSLKK